MGAGIVPSHGIVARAYKCIPCTHGCTSGIAGIMIMIHVLGFKPYDFLTKQKRVLPVGLVLSQIGSSYVSIL